MGELENLRHSVSQEIKRRMDPPWTEAGATCDASGPTTEGQPIRSLAASLMEHDKLLAGNAAQTPRSFAPPRSIGWAVKQLHNGARVQRRGWNGRGQWLALQIPDGGSFMTLPYIYIRTVGGDRVPWLASQTDILATDWQIA